MDAASVSDITYISTREGFLCLAVSLDVANRGVVRRGMDDTPETALPLAALGMAILQRQPAPFTIRTVKANTQAATTAPCSTPMAFGSA